ncbi:MAG: short-chain dehydrogenase [Gammaproteobacteria bacterium]|jgi:NAD(P)-dependent dehydrogenase (short-subunit alcohol dehydrogenase family)|nr:short-chain dehydrogenase [Gammaproteobacteria bacterium]
MKRVENKVAIVTGGAMGIGKAACLLLAEQGALVAVTDIHEAKSQETVAEIQAKGGKAAFWCLNTAKESEVKETIQAIDAHFGRIDILVNNAGISGVNKPTHEVSEQEWDALMAVNVKGVFFCTKHVIPFMQKHGGGSIINLSSIYGLVGAPDVPPYHASKGAVRLMTKTDALLYAKDKIRVNSIHPGFIWTPMVENYGKNYPGSQEEFRKYADSLHPLGHIGDPNDIAYGILYLASDEAKFITGSELIIDGGYTAR